MPPPLDIRKRSSFGCLAAEALLLVEGPTDREVLGIWFAEDLLDPRLCVVPTAGGEAARLARTMSKWVQAADRLGNRRVVFLRDRDELTDAEVDSLSRDGVVTVLSVRELENFLLDPAALAAYCSAFSDSEVTFEAASEVTSESEKALQ